MRQVRLGQTELQVSAVAFGTWAFGGDRGAADLEEARTTVHRVLELGITLVDTAQRYGFGAAERLLGDARRERPSQLEGTAAPAALNLIPEELDEIDEILADAVPVWGPRPEGMGRGSASGQQGNRERSI